MAAWCDAGGIVGRGVLIDYARWVSEARAVVSIHIKKLKCRSRQAKKNNVHFDPCLESHQVPLNVIKEIAKEQGVEIMR